MRRFTLAAIAAGAVALAAPAGASAQVSIPLAPGDLLGQGLGATVAGLVCDPLRKVTQPFGELAAGVSDLLCNAGVLDYSFFTVYKRPDGTLVKRETRTSLLLPTLIEVGDGDLLPDLIGTITPLSLDRFKLRIDRMLLETGPLPLSIEAVANDPTSGTLPRKRIAFGYDARASRAPQAFQAEVRVGTSATQAGATTLSIGYDTRSPGTTLDVIGGLFNGAIGARTDPIGARLSYAPVPQKGGVDLVVGKRIEVRKTASSLTKLTADYEDVLGSSETRMRAVVDKLPSWTEVVFDRIATSKNKVTYSSVAPVTAFTLDYTAKPAGVLTQAATVKASGLPTGMTVEQTSAKSGSFTATGGSVTSVEAGYGDNGMPRLLTGVTRPYGYVYEDATMKSYAGRFQGLTTATFDGTEPIVIDATIAARTPFVFKVNTPKLKADGDLQDLPRKVHAFVDLDGGTIEYDGFGDTIDRITVADAFKPEGFFPTAEGPLNRVTRIRGTIGQVPAKATITLQPKSVAGAGFTASSAVGSLEALLTSGPIIDLPAGESGARIEDLPASFAAFARVSGLRELNVKKDAAGVLTANAKLARQPLHLIHRSYVKATAPATVDPGDTTIDARLSAIPDDVTVTFDKSAGRITYKGAQGIDAIDATVTSTEPIVAKRARRIIANVRGIPEQATVVVDDNADPDNPAPPTFSIVSLRAGPRVGSIEVLLSDKRDATLANAPLPAADRGVVIRDLAEEFTIHGRIDGLKRISVWRDERAIVASASIDRQTLRLIYSGPLDSAPGSQIVDLDAKATGIPTELRHLSFAPKTGQVAYEASPGLDALEATLTSAAPLFDRVKRIHALVKRIPPFVELDFKPETGTGGAFSAWPAVGVIEAELSDGGAPTAFPGTGSGVQFTDVASKFELVGRLREVRGASFVTNNRTMIATLDTGPLPDGTRQPFALDATFANGTDFPSQLKGILSALPGSLKITQSGSVTEYAASDPIANVSLHGFSLSGGKKGAINRAEVTLTQVPTAFRIEASDSKSGLTATEGSFGRIDVSLWDVDGPLAAPPEDQRNKALMNTRNGNLKVLLRVFGLKKAVLSEGGSTTTVDTAFAAPPAPLDFHLDNRAGTPEQDASLDITASEIPTQSTITFGRSGTVRGDLLTGTFIGYDANADTADVHAEYRTPNAVALLDAPNIPAHTHVCIGKALECGEKAPFAFVTDDDDVNGGKDMTLLPNDLNVVTDSSGVVHLSGKICLPPTNDKGTPTGASAPYDCAPHDKHFIAFDDLRLKNFRLEMASGNSLVADDDGGGEGEDGLFKLYVDSDTTGLKVRNFKLVNTFSNDVLRIEKDGDPPFRNAVEGSPFFLVVDLDTNFTPFDVPEIEQLSGMILCENLSISPKILGVERDIVPILVVFGQGIVCA